MHNLFFFTEPSACFLLARVTGAAKGDVDSWIKSTSNNLLIWFSISLWSIMLHLYGFLEMYLCSVNFTTASWFLTCPVSNLFFAKAVLNLWTNFKISWPFWLSKWLTFALNWSVLMYFFVVQCCLFPLYHGLHLRWLILRLWSWHRWKAVSYTHLTLPTIYSV